MIIQNILKQAKSPKNVTTVSLPAVVEMLNPRTNSGQVVTAETSKNVATAYRCINILSDDVAKMPLQTFVSRNANSIDRVAPSRMMNLAYLLEIAPNRRTTPFIFKKTMMQWLICDGNAYAWMPLTNYGERPELFVLPSDETWPVYDKFGNIWFRTKHPNGDTDFLPDLEVMHLMINSRDGVYGKSVISYARESLGRQLGAYETQGSFYKQGLSAGGILYLDGTANKEAKKKIRESYEEAMSGSENAARIAIMDKEISKFEQIAMKPVDAQFLESISENDVEIANFFGVPQYKLNAGKQSYESNAQQDLDYLKTTLDPYLVQWEEEAKLKWLRTDEQLNTYFRFNRDAILRTDAKTRAEITSKRIQSGVLTPNEGRQIEDLSGYPGGDLHLVPANMAVVNADGTVSAISKPVPATEEADQNQ